MFCNVCGSQIPDEYDFCSNCGADMRAFKKIPQPESENVSTEEEQAFAPVSDMSEIQSAESFSADVQDIPIPEAVDDAEGGTTVLSAADLGFGPGVDETPVVPETSTVPETSAVPETSSFSEASSVSEPAIAPEASAAPEVPEAPKVEKVVTPAPVTGSSILSNENVSPVTPVVPAQNVSYNNNNNNASAMNNQDYNPYGPQSNMGNMNQMPGQGVTIINQNASGAIPPEYKPISVWGYIGYNLLFSIPLIGLIMLFVMGFGNQNINVKNYAKSMLLVYLIVIIIYIILIIFAFLSGAPLLRWLQRSGY